MRGSDEAVSVGGMGKLAERMATGSAEGGSSEPSSRVARSMSRVASAIGRRGAPIRRALSEMRAEECRPAIANGSPVSRGHASGGAHAASGGVRQRGLGSAVRTRGLVLHSDNGGPMRGIDDAGDTAAPRHRALLQSSEGERRQSFHRVPFSHAQIPTGVPTQTLRHRASVGRGFRRLAHHPSTGTAAFAS